jgi:hypothetical protein
MNDMKRFVKIIMVLVSVTICCGTMYGQGRPDRDKRMTREQLAAVQARHISDALSLDDETSGIFIDTYCRFQEEIWALGPRPGRYEHKTDSTATAEEIDKAIQDKFERSRQILEIREKYYEEYSRFLSPKQIQEMYEIERRMMDRLSRRNGNIPERRPGPRPR